MTETVSLSTEQAPPAEEAPLPKKSKYTRKTKSPVLSNNPAAPPVPPLPAAPVAGAPEPAPAAATPEPAPAPIPAAAAPKRRTRRTRKPETVKVVLTGNFKGFHAFEPTILFVPGVSVTVPNDGWIQAQLKAKYLKEV